MPGHLPLASSCQYPRPAARPHQTITEANEFWGKQVKLASLWYRAGGWVVVGRWCVGGGVCVWYH